MKIQGTIPYSEILNNGDRPLYLFPEGAKKLAVPGPLIYN